MKIYFAGSIRGGREEEQTYFKIIDYLTNFGEVLTEHVGFKNIDKKEQGSLDTYIFERDVSWLKSANMMIADVTVPSLGVGYEIGFAETLNIPILCLYNSKANKPLSAMISGNKNLVWKEYNTVEEAKLLIDKFMKSN